MLSKIINAMFSERLTSSVSRCQVGQTYNLSTEKGKSHDFRVWRGSHVTDLSKFSDSSTTKRLSRLGFRRDQTFFDPGSKWGRSLGSGIDPRIGVTDPTPLIPGSYPRICPGSMLTDPIVYLHLNWSSCNGEGV